MSGMTQDELEMSEEISTLLMTNKTLTKALDSIAKILLDAQNSSEYGDVSDSEVLEEVYVAMDKYTKDAGL